MPEPRTIWFRRSWSQGFCYWLQKQEEKKEEEAKEKLGF